MGVYSRLLSLRLNSQRAKQVKPMANAERLCAVAIMRDGEVHKRGFKEHWRLRAALDQNNLEPHKPVPGDIDGFVTTSGRFVDRAEAQTVALLSGQIRERIARPMLSSDLDW